MKTMSQIQIIEIKMIRGNGYGQYKIVVDFNFEGVHYRKSFHTTDSQLWDSDEKTSDMLLEHIGGEEIILDTI